MLEAKFGDDPFLNWGNFVISNRWLITRQKGQYKLTFGINEISWKCDAVHICTTKIFHCSYAGYNIWFLLNIILRK